MAGAYVYMVQCQDGTYYTGYTTCPERRVATHNSGKGAKYCRSRRPVKLVYVLPCRSRTEALILEHAIKGLRRPSKQLLSTVWKP